MELLLTSFGITIRSFCSKVSKNNNNALQILEFLLALH